MNKAKTEPRRVLVMDDEEGLRRVVARMLRFLGHEVTTVCEGQQAIDEYRRALDADERFDVVILDLTVLDGLGGLEALAGLLDVDPAVKVIASSGYTADDTIDNFAAYGFAGALAKPYRIQDLRETIEAVTGQ